MHQERLIFLLYMCTTAVSFSLAFNIDLRNPDVYDGDAEDFFGFKVLQVGSKNDKGVIVTAPLYMNGSGAVYLQRQNKMSPPFTAKPVTVKEKELPVKHFGLSIAKDLTKPHLTVCSPNVVTRCNENSYMNSVCYNLTDQLQEQSVFKPAFQGCTKKTVDLAFLFDGSTSMTEQEFEKNKDFIEDIMLSLKNTSIKFAAVQFSSSVRTVFTFNNYTNNVSSSMLKKEPQLKGLTNTHKALDFVLENHLNNTLNGASHDSTKVLVLITDGDPSDTNKGSIEKYDSMNIIRFIIGVKEVDVTKLRVIASEPKDNNTFHIENYNGLTGVLENFQKKIFQTEGTTAALAGDLKEEMSQTGFSAVYGTDALLLGSVGSKTWRGSLHELRGETETHIQDSEMEEDAYMGYSVAVGNKNKTALYFTGAPRYKHMGRVVLFTSTSGKWTPALRINGEQHGSYFGAEVCSVDVDSDGNTDFLFVGAPLFYQSQRAAEGKIYIYKLTDKLRLIKQFNITALVMGRFGTTIASVADVNGDGLRDAAVGAPLENHNRGAVYLFLGHRSRGIRSTHSQRILAEEVHPGLQFFGQSIDGSIDAGNDGLPDLLVGSRGSAVVLKSKPVFSVTPFLTFEPHEINIDKIKCVPSNMNDFIPMVTLKICFEMFEATKSSPGAVKPGLNISYSLDVDPMRQTFRGFFNQTTKRSRNLTETYELRNRVTCFNRSVYMPKCVIDTLSPIKININFSQVESESADAALNTDSIKEVAVEVPFEKRCRNDTCIAEIEVDFDFMSPSLLVADHNQFNVSITLSNRGEDSYNTSLTINHGPGLSFSRMSLLQDSKSKPLYSCQSTEERTACGVSLPVYRGQSQAKFMCVFRVIRDYEWKESLSLNITGHSDNQNSSKGSLVKDIPVQFEIKMTLMTLIGENRNYMNLTTEDAAPKRLETKYRVDNYGWQHFPANVTLVFPTKLDHKFEMYNYQVLVEQNVTQCTERDSSPSSENNDYCTPERECKYIVCDPFILTNASVEFELSGEVQFKDLGPDIVPFLKRYTGDNKAVEFKSFLSVEYDKQKYSLDHYNHKRNSDGLNDNREDNDPSKKSSPVHIELILLPDKLLIIATGAGGGLLLLILIAVIMFKLGCFKRKLQDMIQDEEEDEDETEDKEDQEDEPEENKELLEKQEISDVSTTDV